MVDRVTVVGSGDAFNAGGRRHACYLVEGDGFAPLMVDFGATALLGLRQLGRQPTEIGAFLVTHLHGDHIGGFPYLVIDGMFNAVRTAPLPVIGPAGVEARVDGFLRAAYGDLADRPRPYALSFEELLPGEQTVVEGVTVRGFAAEHMDLPERPLCLQLELPSGRRVAFSGDTQMCDGLRRAADGVDLLIAECSGLAPPMGRHCTWEDWQRELPTVGAREVMLTHLGEGVRAAVDRLLAEAPPGASLRFADDGLCVPIGGDATGVFA